MNSLNRYNNPILALHYDQGEQGSNHGDIEFYTKLFKNSDKKILELGCGAGRMTIALKKAGINIIGSDAADAMVKIARKKSAKQKVRIKFVIMDALKLDLKERFDAITFPYNSICLIAENKFETLIKKIKNHLKPGGEFVFDISRPKQGKLSKVNHVSDWSDFEKIKNTNIFIRRKVLTAFDKGKHLKNVTYYWEIKDNKGKVEKRKTTLSFSTHDVDWYLKVFKKFGFQLLGIYEKTNKINKRAHAFVRLQVK